jgi:hypothetical protein
MKTDELILKPNKLKTFGLLLISILFVLVGFSVLEEQPLFGWTCIAFFGLGATVFLIQMVPNSTYLKLNEEGFEVRNLFRSDFTKWKDVKFFRIGSVPMPVYLGYWRQKKMVMLEYQKTHKKHKIGKAASKMISGNHGALPDSYGMSVAELVELLNEWKNQK